MAMGWDRALDSYLVLTLSEAILVRGTGDGEERDFTISERFPLDFPFTESLFVKQVAIVGLCAYLQLSDGKTLGLDLNKKTLTSVAALENVPVTALCTDQGQTRLFVGTQMSEVIAYDAELHILHFDQLDLGPIFSLAYCSARDDLTILGSTGRLATLSYAQECFVARINMNAIATSVAVCESGAFAATCELDFVLIQYRSSIKTHQDYQIAEGKRFVAQMYIQDYELLSMAEFIQYNSANPKIEALLNRMTGEAVETPQTPSQLLVWTEDNVLKRKWLW